MQVATLSGAMDPCIARIANTTIGVAVNDNCCYDSTTTNVGCPSSIHLLRPVADDDVTSECCRHWPILLLSLLVVAGITGNTLVCCAVAVERKLRNVTNYFLVSLAVTDLLVSMVVMPACIAHDFIGYWPFGLALCNIWQFADVTLCTSSIMHMCIISLDRYTAIRHPLTSRRRRTKSTVSLRIAGVWIISVAIASPLIAIGVRHPTELLADRHAVVGRGGGEALDEPVSDGPTSMTGYGIEEVVPALGRVQCGIFNEHYLVFGSLTAFFGPLVIMLVTYALTIRLLRRRAVQVEKRMRDGTMRRTVSQRQRQRPRSTAMGNGQPPGRDPVGVRRSFGDGIVRNNWHSASSTVNESLRGAKALSSNHEPPVADGERFRSLMTENPSEVKETGNHRDSTISDDVTATDRTLGGISFFRSGVTSSCSPLMVTPSETPADDEEDEFGEIDASEQVLGVAFEGRKTNGNDLAGPPHDRNSRRTFATTLYGSSKLVVAATLSSNQLRWEALRRRLHSKTPPNVSVSATETPFVHHARSARIWEIEPEPTDGVDASGSGCNATGNGSNDTDSDLTPVESGDASSSHKPFQIMVAPRHVVVRLANAIAVTGIGSASSMSSLRHPIVSDLVSAQPSPADGASSSASPSGTMSSRFRCRFAFGGSRDSTGSSLLRPCGSTSSTMIGVQTERKAIKVVGTMFALFVACWASFFVVNLTSGICRHCKIDERIFKSFLWLGYASSTVNPIIYTIFNRSFKRTFVRILTCADCHVTSSVTT